MPVRLALALALLSAGCLHTLPPPACLTPCGMKVRYAEGARPACADVERAEVEAMLALAQHAKVVDTVKLCRELPRWTLQLGYIGGNNTECTAHYVALELFDWGGLAHELGHVSDFCAAYQEKHTGPGGGLLDWLSPNPIDYHHGWDTLADGRRAAINAADEAWLKRK